MRLTRQLRKFYISRDLIEDNPRDVRELLSQCIVVRAELLYHMDKIEYVAMSDRFDEVPMGAEVPVYQVHCDSHSTLGCRLRFHKDSGEPIVVGNMNPSFRDDIQELRERVETSFQKFKKELESYEVPRGYRWTSPLELLGKYWEPARQAASSFLDRLYPAQDRAQNYYNPYFASCRAIGAQALSGLLGGAQS